MADSLQPNPLTIGADGDVQAQGVDLPAPALPGYPPGAVNSVRWLRAADGVMVAEIDAYDQGGDSSQPVFRDTVQPANYGPAGNGANREIGVYDHNSNPILQLMLQLANDGYGSGQPNADDTLEVWQRGAPVQTIYRASTGASSFLQLLAAQRLQLAFGVEQVTVAADTFFAIAHGLGRVPQLVMASAHGWMGYLESGSSTVTDINLAANVALNNNFVYWFALG